MNRITIIGNLTRPPEMRTTQSGIAVCTFTVVGTGAEEAPRLDSLKPISSA